MQNMTTKLASFILLYTIFFVILLMSSHVAAEGFSLKLQLVPHACHLPWRLVMCRVVIFDATKLAELQAVHVFYWSWAVKLLYPHSHAHILHFEQLHHIVIGFCYDRDLKADAVYQKLHRQINYRQISKFLTWGK